MSMVVGRAIWTYRSLLTVASPWGFSCQRSAASLEPLRPFDRCADFALDSAPGCAREVVMAASVMPAAAVLRLGRHWGFSTSRR